MAYTDLYAASKAARQSAASAPRSTAPGGILPSGEVAGGSLPGVIDTGSQLKTERDRQIAGQEATTPAPEGYHWGILPDGSFGLVKDQSFFDSTLGPLLGAFGPALAFGTASALAPAAAGSAIPAAPAGGIAYGPVGGGIAGMGTSIPAGGLTGGLGAAGAAGSGAAGAAGAAKGASSVLPAAVGGASGASGIAKWLPPVIAGAGALAGASAQGKANDLSQQAIDLVKQDYMSREPLRQRFLTGVGAPLPQAPDMSALFADPGNPYSKPVPRRTLTGPLYQAA